MKCQHCGSVNKKDAVTCEKCGAPLPAEKKSPEGMPPDWIISVKQRIDEDAMDAYRRGKADGERVQQGYTMRFSEEDIAAAEKALRGANKEYQERMAYLREHNREREEKIRHAKELQEKALKTKARGAGCCAVWVMFCVALVFAIWFFDNNPDQIDMFPALVLGALFALALLIEVSQ